MDEEVARNGSRPKLGPDGGGGADLISALPDDLLLQVLERLGSVAAAASTGLVSHRWLDLWTRLPRVTVALRDVSFGSLEAALRSAAARPGLCQCHYLLDIRVPGQGRVMVFGSRVSSLLHAAAALSPAELRFTLPRDLQVHYMDADLPCFRRATSIELQARELRLRQKGEGQFHSLERLSLSGCRIDLDTFIPRCPRLRRLSLNTTDLVDVPFITIHSASLEELIFEHRNRWTGLSRISVEAPLLKRLTTSFHARSDVGVSVSAPVVDKVSWRCLYTRVIHGLGLWGLSEVGVKTVEQTDSRGGDACLQLPSVHVMSLHMCAQAVADLTAEIEKHMIVHFSVLELHLDSRGHVFGAFALHLLGMRGICTATQRLKVVLLRSEDKEACPANCPCDQPRNWRSQSISLTNLENVEIEGFEGENHEFDFLELIFRCATMLKRVNVRPSDEVTTSNDWCTKICDIFKAYPFVECNLDLSSGSDGSEVNEDFEEEHFNDNKEYIKEGGDYDYYDDEE